MSTAASDQLAPIVVIGGGFAGLTTALAFRHVHPRPPIVLIEPRERFVFVPLLYELLSGELKGWEVAPTYASLLQGRGISHVQDHVQSVDLKARTLKTASAQTMTYSQLVIATGAQPTDFGIPGVRDHALRFHTLSDLAPLQQCLQQVRRRPSGSSTLVIAGAGATGVELACKLFDMLDGAAAIQLVELGERILSRSRAFNREQAQQALQKRGITVRLNTRVDAVTPTSVNLNGAEGALTLAHDGLIWTAGSRPKIPDLTPAVTLQGGRLPVTSALRLEGHPEVMALGDIVTHSSDDEGSNWPLSAQAAIQQGQFAAKCLQSHLKGSDPGPFIFRDLGEMLSLGIGDASLTGLGITLAGPLAFKLRRLTYLTRLPGLSLGLKSAGAWLVSP
ncbi:MAG: NAD(P)/FAD-dependent oxidoreductase [Cyanobacteriota bacterium]|nr:NAD(P)/FAD-dependent oxidoreductase [Cyanobacteriota bacterium]